MPLRVETGARGGARISTDVVSLLGLRDDVPACMAAADATVLASAWEGLPTVVIESLAVETPIVCTDVGGVREIVENGRSGFVVPSREPRSAGDGDVGDDGLFGRGTASDGRARTKAHRGQFRARSRPGVLVRIVERIRRGGGVTSTRPRLVHLVDGSDLVWPIRGHAALMTNAGFEAHAISSPESWRRILPQSERSMTSRSDGPANGALVGPGLTGAPCGDAQAPQAPRPVQAGTPKAGLLGMIAAHVPRVPTAFTTRHGLPMLTAQGLSASSCGRPSGWRARRPRT